jgi:hypothetical protein
MKSLFIVNDPPYGAERALSTRSRASAPVKPTPPDRLTQIKMNAQAFAILIRALLPARAEGRPRNDDTQGAGGRQTHHPRA